jgi:hypothetical protein
MVPRTPPRRDRLAVRDERRRDLRFFFMIAYLLRMVGKTSGRLSVAGSIGFGPRDPMEIRPEGTFIVEGCKRRWDWTVGVGIKSPISVELAREIARNCQKGAIDSGFLLLGIGF